MKTKIIFCLALFIFSLPVVLRADYVYYESVEWLTSFADQIGVYEAERVYGPHSITNSPNSSMCCVCTADFKLVKSLRGDPPSAFLRRQQVEKPELLGFHSGDKYIFFFVFAEQGEAVLPTIGFDYKNSGDFFTAGDYLWLDRPAGSNANGVAIDHRGKVLTAQSEILNLVEASLKLPRASPSINRWSYFNRENTNFNFSVVQFPTPDTSLEKEPWAGRIIYMTQGELVIPQCLYEDYSSTTNRLIKPATSH